MEREEPAYRAGIAEAECDIAQGQPKLRYGARGPWGEDLAHTLRARFGVELVVLSCLTEPWSSSFEAGYNATIEAHIDGIHGLGAVASVMGEIQKKAQTAYDLWVSEQNNFNRYPSSSNFEQKRITGMAGKEPNASHRQGSLPASAKGPNPMSIFISKG